MIPAFPDVRRFSNGFDDYKVNRIGRGDDMDDYLVHFFHFFFSLSLERYSSYVFCSS